MFGTDLYIALVIGLILSLIFVEKTGFTPAALIVPGYIALIVEDPIYLLLVLLISLVTYLVVTYGIAKITILDRNRKLVAMVAVGVAVMLIIDYFLPMMSFGIYELMAIGLLVPGLIAYTVSKQGMVFSYVSILLLGGLTYLIMLGYSFI